MVHDSRAVQNLDVDLTQPPFTPPGMKPMADHGYDGVPGFRTPMKKALVRANPDVLSEGAREDAALRVIVENNHASVKQKWRIYHSILNGCVPLSDVPTVMIVVSDRRVWV